MQRALKLLSLLLLSLTCLTAKETNYLLPDLQFVWATPLFDEASAVSLLGEVGNKNFRASGSYGLFLTQNQRIKVGIEGLAQKLSFAEYNKNQWVYQAAAGAEYEYLICCKALRSIDVGGAYSHAFASQLSRSDEDYARRIAGSDGAFFYAGPQFSLTACTLLSVDYNYDYVKYHKRFDEDILASGSGVSAELVQQLPGRFVLTLETDFLQPYNYYSGLLSTCLPFCNMTAGLYANYTDGKKGLPNVMTGGVRLDFVLGSRRISCAPKAEFCCPTPCNGALLNWVRSPAVHIPAVLVNADPEFGVEEETVPAVCVAPTLRGSNLANLVIATSSPTMIDLSSHFTGSPTNYTISSATNVSATVTSSGLLSLTGLTVGSAFNVTVNAATSCGSAPIILSGTVNNACQSLTTPNCPFSASIALGGGPQTFDFTTQFVGSSPRTYMITGNSNLPVASVAINNTTGVLTVTPNAAGSTVITVRAISSACGAPVTCALNLTVTP